MPELVNLRRFLVEKRARLSPSDVGLPGDTKRRAAGLRREEVADLAGMSETWYARFESGRAQLSRKALLRVASALLLDSRETSELVRLASTTPDLESDGPFGGGAAELRVVRRLFKELQSVGSLAEARAAVVGALMDIAHAPCVAFWIEEARPLCGFHFVECAGPYEQHFRGRFEEPSVMAHFARDLLLAGPVAENLAESPSAEHRASAALTGSGSYRAVPVQPSDCERSMRIGWASREVGPFPALPSVAQDLIGDYARWALARFDSVA
jgi:transcriptional regulator with XRE-family HTH domain